MENLAVYQMSQGLISHTPPSNVVMTKIGDEVEKCLGVGLAVTAIISN